MSTDPADAVAAGGHGLGLGLGLDVGDVVGDAVWSDVVVSLGTCVANGLDVVLTVAWRVSHRRTAR